MFEFTTLAAATKFIKELYFALSLLDEKLELFPDSLETLEEYRNITDSLNAAISEVESFGYCWTGNKFIKSRQYRP